MERMDLFLHADAPDSADLPIGTAVRLYAKTGTRCIGEGAIADPSTGCFWGSTSSTIGQRCATRRVVVELTSMLVPGALALYTSPDDEEMSLGALGVNTRLLWDTVSPVSVMR